MAQTKKKTTTKKNPGKTSEDQLEERVAATKDLLAKGMYKGQIKKAISEQYGVSRATVENYLSRARKILIEELKQTTDVHKSDALGFYKSVLADPTATTGNKIQAQKRIDFILGLHAPTRLAITDADGRTLDAGAIESKILDLATSVFGAGAAG